MFKPKLIFFLALGFVSNHFASEGWAAKICESSLRPGQSLGLFKIDPKSRRSSAIEFEILPNTRSFVISADPEGGTVAHDLMIAEIRDPDGKIFVAQSFTKPNCRKGCFGNRAYFPASASQMIPNDATFPKLKAGKWRAVVESSVAIDLAVSLRVQSQVLLASSQKMDRRTFKIYLYLTGSNGLSNKTFLDSTFNRETLPKMKAIFEKSNIKVEIKSVYALPKKFQKLSMIDEAGSISLTQLYAKLPLRDDGFNLIVVDELKSDIGSGFADGVSPGAPASLNKPHIVISNRPRSGERRLPTHALIAHEVAHGLGLFHVEEFDGLKDPLSSTQVGQGDLMDINYSGDLSDQAAWAFNLEQSLVIRSHPYVVPFVR